MKNKIIVSAIAGAALLGSCKKQEIDMPAPKISSTPYEVVSFESAALMPMQRESAAWFTLQGCHYMTTGLWGGQPYKDLWKFDPQNNTWQQRSDMPGPLRYYAVAFATDSFAFGGLGYNSGNSFQRDFYKYDPVSNSWSAKAGYQGPERINGACLSLGNKLYFGLGYDYFNQGNTYSDIQEYNPQTDQWKSRSNAPLGGRNRFFIIGSKAYLTGSSYSSLSGHKFYEFDPLTDTWKEKAGLPGYLTKYDPNIEIQSLFAVDGKGYAVTTFLTTGNGYSSMFDRFLMYRYEPGEDAWKRICLTSQTSTMFGYSSICFGGTQAAYMYRSAGPKLISGNFWKFQPQLLPVMQ